MVNKVSQVTALGRSGVTDWLIQRISALIMLAYVIFLIGFSLGHPIIDFNLWHALFSHTLMRLFNVLVLLALLAHAWIGMWTVLTDYVKCSYARGTLQILIILLFVACFAWGIQIFWS